MVDISVIMPCYNSMSTLEESLDSVLTQNFAGNIELVAVEDCSTDETESILRRRATQDSRLKIVVHRQNMGGGAARNTGIRASAGSFLLVFDSDDVLGYGALQAMYDFLSGHEALDGALFEEQRTFQGNDKQNLNVFRFYCEDRPIDLKAVFQGKKALMGNFMFRRPAFEKAGGYPDHHGFDTQGFCMRFLSNGLHAQVAPGSFFWHRVSGPAASYFERVFAAGRFSLNTYLIYEDMIDLFSCAAINKIMTADVFRKNSFGAESLSAQMEALESAGIAVLKDSNSDSYGPQELGFVAGILAMREKQFGKALQKFFDIAQKGFVSPILHFNIIRCTFGIAGMTTSGIVEESLSAIDRLRTKKIRSRRGWSLFQRSLVKMARAILTFYGFEDPIL